MPVPSPNTGETEDTFISRCISALKTSDPSRPDDQVQAICFSQWRGESLHNDFTRILATFLNHFSDGSGLERFHRFVDANSLDISQPYNPIYQFKESYTWMKPLIKFYKQDTDAKYYAVTAVTANISMNDNDYRNYRELVKAAPSLSMQPVNLNHDNTMWLPYPRTRVDMTGAEDLAIEATLRVDNQEQWLQQQLDNGDIVHPSIQGFKRPDGSIIFTGMALLQKGVELPGDPLSEIVPLILNESIRNKLCRIVDGQVICSIGDIHSNRKMKKGESNLSEQIGKAEFIAQCLASGKSEAVCNALWTSQPAQSEQVMTPTPVENTEMDAEKQAFMKECSAYGKSVETCEAEWQHKLGVVQPPATSLPSTGETSTSGPTQPSDVSLLPPAPRPETGPIVEQDISAEVPANPSADTEYPTTSVDAFMAACLAANAGDADYCTNLWQKIQGLTPDEPYRTDAHSVTELSAQNLRLQTNLVANADRISGLYTTISQLREELSSTQQYRIRYEAEQQHNTALKREIKKLQSYIESMRKAISSSKDVNAISLKNNIDQIRRMERTAETKDDEIKRLEELFDRQSLQTTTLRKDVSELSSKTLAADDRARGAVKDRSAIQIENSSLRDEAARLTRQLSVITAQRSVDAKTIYAAEQKTLKLQEALSLSGQTDQQIRKQIKVSKDRAEHAWRLLNTKGVYQYDDDGNLQDAEGNLIKI